MSKTEEQFDQMEDHLRQALTLLNSYKASMWSSWNNIEYVEKERLRQQTRANAEAVRRDELEYVIDAAIKRLAGGLPVEYDKLYAKFWEAFNRKDFKTAIDTLSDT